jgi:hypothetical protein
MSLHFSKQTFGKNGFYVSDHEALDNQENDRDGREAQ